MCCIEFLSEFLKVRDLDVSGREVAVVASLLGSQTIHSEDEGWHLCF